MKPKFRPRKRKTVKPAPKAEPKRDWMDQDMPRCAVRFPNSYNDPRWQWEWPLGCRFISALFTNGMMVSIPHPSEYINS